MKWQGVPRGWLDRPLPQGVMGFGSGSGSLAPLPLRGWGAEGSQPVLSPWGDTDSMGLKVGEEGVGISGSCGLSGFLGCGSGLTGLPCLVTMCPCGSEECVRKGLIPVPHNRDSASVWGREREGDTPCHGAAVQPCGAGEGGEFRVNPSVLFHFGGNNVPCLSYVGWPGRGQHPYTTTLGVPVNPSGAELAGERVGNLPPR